MKQLIACVEEGPGQRRSPLTNQHRSCARRKTVSREQNSRIAQELLASIGQGADPDEIATLFSGDVQFEIAGDVGALPWIGQKTGRDAASDFFRDTRRLTQPVIRK